jgi:hypothetical protein
MRTVNNMLFSRYAQPQDTPIKTQHHNSQIGSVVQIASHAPRRHREALRQRRFSYIGRWDKF